MPKIPTGGFGQRLPQSQDVTPGASLNTASAEAGARLGATLQEFGGQMLVEQRHLADQAQRQVDANEVFSARRKLDDWERATVFDPERGAIAKKGADAFELPKTLPAEFDQAASKIASGLKTPRQQQAFQEVVLTRRAQVGAFADRHALQERKVYDEGQYQAEIDSSLNRSAMLITNGDAAGAKAETSIAQTRTVGYLRGLGKSEEEISQAVRNVSSRAGVAAVNALLEQDRPSEAEKFIKDNAAGMSADDLVRVQGAIKKSLTARDSQLIADGVYRAAVAPALAPTDSGRLESLVMQAESGGRRNGADGKLLQGPVTRSGERAQGEMQVMPSTARDPGYGIKPADLSGTPDQQAEEIARVGREKLQVMVKRYAGDVPKALAAYNWGEGNVDKAVAKAGGGQGADWLSLAPTETQNYVKGIVEKYGRGGGAMAMPTLQELHDQVRARVPADRPDLRRQAIEETTRRFNDGIAAKKQQDEANTVQAYDWLVKNRGAFANMPASVRAAIPADKFDDVMSFAGKVAAGVPVQTDWNQYADLRALAATDPKQFGKTDLRAYLSKLAPAQFEQLLDLQVKAVNPLTTHEVATLDAQLGNAHDLLKLGNSPADKERKGKFDTVVMSELAVAQKEKGKPLSYEERQKVIDRNMLTTDASSGWFGLGSGKRVYETAGTAAGLTAKPVPTAEDKALIRAALAEEGIKAPTDAQIQARFKLRHGVR